MSQRVSGYEPVPGDCFFTPSWVTEALLSVEDFPNWIWECAAGKGHMSHVLFDIGNNSVVEWDLAAGHDFLVAETMTNDARSIVTNPPYSNGLAEKFVRHALKLTEPVHGKVAMLLPLAWDSAKGRTDIFKEHPAFSAKYILTQRIRWENLEQKKNGPSVNHQWLVWDWNHSGPPTVGYLP